MKFLMLIPVAALAAVIAGCDSGPRPPAVHYVDPNRPIATAGWNEGDLKTMTDTCFQQLLQRCLAKKPGQRPRVMLSKIGNRTQEIIDTYFIARKMFTAMSSCDQFELIDAQAREDIAAEYNYQQSGYVDPTAAKGPGHQEAAEYMLRGELFSITNPSGWSEVKQYNLTLYLTDIEKGTQVGQWDCEITKVINR